MFFEATLFISMVRMITVWYLSNRKDTHGQKTLALANLPSKHDHAASRETTEKDCTIFIGKRDWMPVGTMHCAVLASNDVA